MAFWRASTIRAAAREKAINELIAEGYPESKVFAASLKVSDAQVKTAIAFAAEGDPKGFFARLVAFFARGIEWLSSEEGQARIEAIAALIKRLIKLWLAA